MDPVSLAIVAAISAGLSSGVGRVSQDVVLDAYESLKAVLRRKFGHDSSILNSVEALELKPTSAARKSVLEEEILENAANDDAEILGTALTLLKLLEVTSSNENHVQQAIGSYIAQADRNGRAEVRVNQQNE